MEAKKRDASGHGFIQAALDPIDDLRRYAEPAVRLARPGATAFPTVRTCRWPDETPDEVLGRLLELHVQQARELAREREAGARR